MASKKRAKAPSAGPGSATPGSPRVVAVTGAFGSLGRRFVSRLEADPAVDRIVAFDVKSALSLDDGTPSDPASWLGRHAKLSAYDLDLSEAGADHALAEILARERVGALVHLAFLQAPTHALELAHELETIGTLYTLHACAEARVGYVLSLSSAMCYGARPENPAWITEEQPLHPPPARSLTDKADADEQVLRFGAQNPACGVAVARLGAVLGTAPEHFWTRTFRRRLVPAVLGYDPLMQLMWVDDAIDALHALLKAGARGAFNVVGRGVLPLSHVLTRLGRAPLYLPAQLGQSLIGALWSAQLVDMPPRFLDYLRWSWVCDGERLRAATGFHPAHDIAATLRVFAQSGGARAREVASTAVD